MPISKTIRACERCRQHKSRCLPGSSSTSCAGCEHAGTRCVPHMPVKRGVKAQQTIEDLSRQVAALQLALQQQSNLALPYTCYDPSERQNSSNLGGLLARELASAQVSKALIHDTWTMSLDSLVLTLRRYNEMAIAVPFALEVDTEGVSRTADTSPVLILAALNVSPNLEPHIAKQLDITFHRVLADQAMVQGKQNYDILGGLITYLLWFHHRYDPETQQFFQYLQLAKAMAEDLQVRKCLDTGIDPISGNTRVSVARTLAGLYFVDQGTSRLDDTRRRQPMSVDDVQLAFSIISAQSQRRPADFDAENILDLLYENASNMPSRSPETDSLAEKSSCLYYNTIKHFSYAWVGLQEIGSMSTLELQVQSYINAAERLKNLVNHICQQPPSYLQTMTIVEWAYLLTALVKAPHVERCAPTYLQGYTTQLVDRMRSHLLIGQQINLDLLRQTKHIWWLEGVLNDAMSVVAAPQDPSKADKLLRTSTYELLEQLTERLTGFRKGVKTDSYLPQDGQTCSDVGDNFDKILAEWVHIDQTQSVEDF